MSTKNISLTRLPIFKSVVAVLLLTIFIGCKSDDQNGQSQTTAQATTDTAKKALAFSVGTFSYIKMTKAQVVALFANASGNPNGATKKILLQYVDDNTASNTNPIALVAYGADVHNVRTSGPIVLEAVDVPAPESFAGLKYLGNLEITRKQLNVIFGREDGNPPLGDNNTADLYFTPMQGTGTNASYILYYVSAAEFITDKPKLILLPPTTNPSPPAIPCPEPCD